MAESNQTKSNNRKRGAIKRRLTLLNKYVLDLEALDTLSKEQAVQLQLRLSLDRQILDEFNLVQLDIETLCDDEALESEYLERDQFQSNYFDTISKMQCLLTNYTSLLSDVSDNLSGNASGVDQQPSHPSSSIKGIQLPTIQLPKFKGCNTNWLEFKDTFESLIHNASISEIQKFHYLRASLEGTALQTIKSIEFSADNYMGAWEILCDRYNNNQLLINNHIKAILELPNVTKPTSTILHQIVDDLSKHLKSLKSLKLPVEYWDMIIIHITCNKLDKESLRHWEEFKNSDQLPTMKEFKSFLKSRADLLETLESREEPKVPKLIRNVAFISSNMICNFCKGSHPIYQCSKFLKLSIESRLQEVNMRKLCINCLLTGHVAKFCKSRSCKKCHKKHNTLLHLDRLSQSNDSGSFNKQSLDQGETRAEVKYSSRSQTHTLLSTAKIIVIDSRGKQHLCRALLDSGSQTHFISSSLYNKLGLINTKANLSISGINNINSIVHKKCQVSIRSKYNDFSQSICCYILPKISDNLPLHSFNFNSINIPGNIELADPEFNESAEIDLLIGASLFWQILRDGKINLSKNNPTIQNTEFGWIIAGPLNLPSTNKSVCNFLQNSDVNLNNQMRQFWEVEENISSHNMTTQESKCESFFKNTVSRNSDGRLVVRIPFKEPVNKLGNSKFTSLKRFYSLERKLHLNPVLKHQYINFMDEYERLGHMSKISTPVDDACSFYLPHHGIIKETSLTSKIRVVFDGSAPSDSGWSLNDLQHVGPNLQTDILNILIRFRQHSIVFTSDIEKMYRQILVSEEDRRYQRIWWRSNKTDDLQEYQLNTVTYGTTSAPYLAIRCLNYLADENKQTFPEASTIIKRDMYVDDLISGTESIDNAILLCTQISNVLSEGCFELRKWASNKPEVLQAIGTKNIQHYLQNFGDDSIKTLGLQWHSKTDNLGYQIQMYTSETITKRTILSEISQIYDPLGLLCPSIILTKIMLQKLWSYQLHWDENIPDELKNKWLYFRTNLQFFNSISIPRHVICDDCVTLDLHGFSDASINAYAACVYARSIDKNGNIFARLYCAKTKVAPLKALSIPRLELCGALLLTRLMLKIKNSILLPVNCHYWTDSQIVLCWIMSESSSLQTFVSNRVSEIQQNSLATNWRHVESKENPADIASRGVQPEQLSTETMWWNGPHWLSLKENCWPIKSPISINKLDVPEYKQNQSSFFVPSLENVFPFKQFSDFIKLTRITALSFRFINNCKNVKAKCIGPISVNELSNARNRLIKLAQYETYSDVINLLKSNKVLPNKHRLTSLTPFLDSSDILRVGGRMKNSKYDFNFKHPVLLSAKHILTKMIFNSEHLKLYHAGPQLLLSSIRTKYWVLNGRNLARKVVHDCIRCFRANPKTVTPLMGDLPTHRVQQAFPFEITGTDYAGPFMIRERRGRGKTHFKAYICLFVCLTTKALHLEIVSDLTSDSFLNLFKRFIARRGKPSHVYSDNGTSYVGANNELKELYESLKLNSNVLATFFGNEGITWHFMPPHSPNFGGLWEAAVKGVKHHLKRVLGNNLFTLENFMSVIVQIEGILNSRPLSSMSSDPNDFQPLTPAHFLLGRSGSSIPEHDLRQLNPNRLSNFQHIQQLQQHFWTRWSKEYLTELQTRSKWRTSSENISIGTLVLLKEDNLPVFCWKLGRILELHPGSDGIVRVVSVKTPNSVLKRAVSKVCPLPINTTVND